MVNILEEFYVEFFGKNKIRWSHIGQFEGAYNSQTPDYGEWKMQN